ncbi:hypothetical protein BT63DRAFT_419496 [Microthyrium microscopicum]|uniref:Sulfate transporter n=1 Tax=Microthyrium microscopicum TaxID=703497 RepID=A0A6A6UQZ3_9PEZI|nr:hypothetical protein BT63DRAFT_419496 [Microthyrium microscopicum]
MPLKAHLSRVSRRNVQTFKVNPLSEISGSLGDLGTLLPIFIALALNGSIAVSSTLVFTGLANIATGLLFGLPIPVQPMKAIAAVAIDQHFSIQETAVAGLIVSVVIFLLSISGTLDLLNQYIPLPVVRGIQVGAGLQLIITAGTSLLKPLGWVRPSWADNHLWTLFAFVFLLLCTAYSKRHIPYALIITLLGVLFAILSPRDHYHSHTHPSLWNPQIYVPDLHDFKAALPAAIGQIPLTTLNSILATSHLSKHLFSEEPAPSLAHLGLTLSVTNFISFIFGGMPICHGSGGLAAQYHFGARSGASVIFLGLVKLILGLFFANPVVWVVERFPHSLLGIMVIAAGMELAKVAESLNTTALDLEENIDGNSFRMAGDEERKKRFSVMLVTIAGILAFKNDAVGFLAGVLWYIVLYWDKVWSNEGRRSWLGIFRAENTEETPLLDAQ